tara:strand:- start:207 stop:374 length:168 start_codon:yes stop_codon:yes gene_type:complete
MVSRYIVDESFDDKESIDKEVMVHVKHIATSVAGKDVSDDEALDFYNTYNLWQGK